MKKPIKHKQYLKKLFIISLFIFFLNQPLSANDQLGYVSDCRPCNVKLGPDNYSYSFYFETKPFGAEELKLEKIYIKKPNSDKIVQELHISDMVPIFKEDKFFSILRI